ncbi:MAG: NAD(P)-dependent alcohol dehydrogenase [Pseudomonadota bacterium]
MRAVVLERVREIAIREIELPSEPGPDDVLIKTVTVGVCGSDVHYYTHGRIGPFVVEAPMVLGHEASGIVERAGSNVTHLKPGDRVCMEPGIPDPTSKASKLGIYNVDPAVKFWATPPIHGCLAPQVVHPAAFTYKLPEEVSFQEGAVVEPLAIGVQAATRARIQPGDVAVVTGAGPIGIVVALAALAGGCSKVIISDVTPPKLAIAGRYANIVPVNITETDLKDVVMDATSGWGADVVFEASGAPPVFQGLFDLARPGGAVVLVGMPVDPVPIDIVAAQARELRIETVFRYANVFERALNLIASGVIDVKPLITGTYAFEDSVAAFERAAQGQPDDVKIQIEVAHP